MYILPGAATRGLLCATGSASRCSFPAFFRRLLVGSGLFFGTVAPAFAVVPPTDSLRLDLDRDLADQLLPFEELYQIAVRNSPNLKEELTLAETKVENAQLARLGVLHGISLTGNVTRGNQALVSNGTTTFDYLQISNGYRVGVQVMLPLETLLSRRPRIRQAEADYRTALARADVVKFGLKRELNKVYYELLTSQRLLNLYLQDEQAALVAFRSVELDWQKGRATVQEYSAASRVYTDVRIKVEGARGGFFSLLRELTILVGADISELKR